MMGKEDVVVEIDSGSGFCFGVVNAINKAEQELRLSAPLYCLGDIVHNGQEVKRLAALGLQTIDHEAMRRLHGVKVLLRAHGEPPSTYRMARENGITVIDASCPVVLMLQKRIRTAYANSNLRQEWPCGGSWPRGSDGWQGHSRGGRRRPLQD